MIDNTYMQPFVRLGALVNLVLAALYALATYIVYQTDIFIVTAGVTALVATFALIHLYSAMIGFKECKFSMSGLRKKGD